MTTIISNLVETRKKALKFLKQGNLSLASQLLKKLIDAGETDLKHEYQNCHSLMIKSAWKEGHLDQLRLLAEGHLRYSLALAHLGDTELFKSLEKRADKIGILAKCSQINCTKTALLQMRREPELTHIANGWLSLIKKDYARAFQSFTLAEHTQPLRSRIGQALIHLQNQDYLQAEALLAHLKPYAQRFPILAKLLGWSSDKSTIPQFRVKTLFYQTSLKEFERQVNKVISEYPQLKPWFFLRHGDLLYANNKQKQATLKWDKALQSSRMLLADVKKRFILKDLNTLNLDQAQTSILQFYRSIQKEYPQLAREFLEIAIFTYNNDHIHHLTISEYNEETEQWSIDPLPPELVLLQFKIVVHKICYLTFQNNEKNLAELIHQKKIPSHHYLLQFIEILDQHYKNKEEYLLLKISILGSYEEKIELQKTYVDLYKLNPNRIKESIEHYAQLAYSTIHKATTKQEIHELIVLFPSSYHIIRLNALCTPTKANLTLTTHLSPSLKAILELQLSLDKKKGDLVSHLPSLNLLGLDQEADFHFIVILLENMDFEESIAPQTIQRYYDKLFANIENAVYSFQKLMRFYDNNPRLENFLCRWMDCCPNNWHAFYYFADYKGDENDPKGSLERYQKAFNLMKGDESKYIEVKEAIKFFTLEK